MVTAILSVLLCGIPAHSSDTIGYNISPKASLADNERIIGLTITLTNGTFRSFNNIPEGWYFRLDNSTHKQEALSGEVSVGAGALYGKELSDILVCVNDRSIKTGKLAVSGEILVTTDFVKTKKIRLTQADFATRPCVPSQPNPGGNHP